MSAVALLAVATLASVGLTWAVRRYALRNRLLDHPNARSSHTVPTPRGGGMGIVVVFSLASVWLWHQGLLGGAAVVAVAGGGICVALVGWLDDHAHVPSAWRFLVHVGSAGWGLLWAGGLPALALAGFELDPGWPAYLLGIVGVAWLVNLFNFMDGIDGIAAVEAIVASLGAALLLGWRGQPEFALWAMTVAAASAGFLCWNWPPARIFMGDVGSGFLGFVLAMLAIVTSKESGLNLWVWVILLAVFVTDSTVTLIRRVIRGARWYEAHRSHAYQWAARRWNSHQKVTAAVLVLNIVWLWPLAACATAWQDSAPWLTVIAYLPLIVIALRLRAGEQEPADSVRE